MSKIKSGLTAIYNSPEIVTATTFLSGMISFIQSTINQASNSQSGAWLAYTTGLISLGGILRLGAIACTDRYQIIDFEDEEENEDAAEELEQEAELLKAQKQLLEAQTTEATPAPS